MWCYENFRVIWTHMEFSELCELFEKLIQLDENDSHYQLLNCVRSLNNSNCLNNCDNLNCLNCVKNSNCLNCIFNIHYPQKMLITFNFILLYHSYPQAAIVIPKKCGKLFYQQKMWITTIVWSIATIPNENDSHYQYIFRASIHFNIFLTKCK